MMQPSRRTVLAAVPAALSARPLTFGVATDIHQDVMHDAGRRLTAFLDACERRKPDFIIQLGDFCRPIPANTGFRDLFESFAGPRYHVLGNHDIDGGFTWPQTLEYLKLERRYYSFDRGGWHFVVLDGNERAPGDARPGYPAHVGEEQREWLARDLAETALPTVVFSHQPLDRDPAAVDNAAEVRAVLEAARLATGRPKTIAAFCGHLHADYTYPIAGIHYVQVNSMSYHWVGEKFAHKRYGEPLDTQFPLLPRTAPYAAPLFAFVTLRPSGEIRIEGTRSRYVGPSPWDLGVPERPGSYREKGRTNPWISSRRLRVS